MKARVKVVCSICKRPIALTATGRYWTHGTPTRCIKSGRAYAGQAWDNRHRDGRPITLTPGPDTYQPTQGAA